MRFWVLVFCAACGVEDGKDGDFVHEDRGSDDTAAPAEDECDPGTTLDGDACVDIDECEEDNGGCGDPDLYDCINREAAEPICRFNPTQDWEALMKGIDGLSFGGSYASTIISHGDQAFPVVLDTANRAVVAAARFGEGRILHVGHEGVMNSHDALVLNAVHWMSQESPVIGVHADQSGLGEVLSASGYTVETRTATQLAGLDIWVGNTYADLSDEDYETFQAFIEGGGGVITGGHAWYWSYSNDNAAEEHPSNRMLWGSGLTITHDYSAPGDLPVTQVPDFPRVQASFALDEMLLHQSGEYPLEMDLQVLAAGTVSYAVSILPLSFDAYYDRIRDFRAEVDDVTPTAEDPVIPADDPIRGLVVSIDNRFANELPPDELEAWPGVADFPGAVPEDASRLAVSLEIDASYAGQDSAYWYSGAGADVWRSTGLYIPAGELVSVGIPASAVDSGLTALIGAHTDSIWGHDEWSRMPEMTRSYALQSTETIVASAFGGLLYIRVPGGTDLGSIEVAVDGAVEAPRFVLGETSNEAWTAGIRDLPGPWAELASESFILTVPSAQVRELDDPEALMSLWRDVLEGDNALLGLGPEDRVRAERMVFDRQISAGWMHSGYPTMAHDVSVAENLSVEALMSAGSWGVVHELGHNHQYGPWILPGTTETTCNLFSVYASENYFGIDRSVAHPALDPTSRMDRTVDHLASGAPFEDWSVWVALESYLQLQEAFGWALYIDVFTHFREQSYADWPADDQERIDQWVVATSTVAGVDLGPFFVAWGLPVSEWALDDAASLPLWEDDPMAAAR